MDAKTLVTASNLASTVLERHAIQVHRFLRRRVRHAQDVDDLAQEVFARLLRVRDVELVRDPLAYVLGIASHVVLEFRQRRCQEPVLYDSLVASQLSESLEAFASTDPAEQLELQNRVDRAFANLPPTHRLVLLLVKRDGLSYAEAARVSGLSIHTIEKYVVEARARLRIALAEL